MNLIPSNKLKWYILDMARIICMVSKLLSLLVLKHKEISKEKINFIREQSSSLILYKLIYLNITFCLTLVDFRNIRFSSVGCWTLRSGT